MVGRLYLIPVPLDPEAISTLPPYWIQSVLALRCFFVENERSARRFLKKLDPSISIDGLDFHRMDQQVPADLEAARKILERGSDIGVISEAGCPAVADPGNSLVRLAHHLGSRVIPLVGPSSIILALMASGMNGQNFCFHGYLPLRGEERKKSIAALEKESRISGQTQIFIETPYRNNALITDLLATCSDSTRLCVAAGLTGPGEFIRTQTIVRWREQPPSLHKIPAIFLLQSGG